jgi:hypothetical protein
MTLIPSKQKQTNKQKKQMTLISNSLPIEIPLMEAA